MPASNAVGLAMQFFACFVDVAAGGLWHESQWHLHTFFPHSLATSSQKGGQDRIFYQMCHSLLTKSFKHGTINSLEFREGPLSQAFQQSEEHSPRGQYSDSGSGH